MKLKFFEKNEIKEQTVVDSPSIASPFSVLSKAIKQVTDTGSLFRTFTKKVLFYNEYTDGTSFEGTFKSIDINRGEAEVRSRSTGRSQTKSLSARFDGTAQVERSTTPESINYNFQVPRLRLEPILDVELTDSSGTERVRLADGFTDPNYNIIHLIANRNAPVERISC